MNRKKTTKKLSNAEEATGKTNMPSVEYGNFFKQDYAIIMDPVPYLKKIIFDIPRRMAGHHIIYFKKGTAHATINFKEYTVHAGDLFLVPDNYILYIKNYSEDAIPWISVCKFNTPTEEELVGIETTFMHLSQEEIKLVENYFSLMHTVAAQPIYGPDDFRHLVLSLMYRIREMQAERSGNSNNTKLSSNTQLAAKFVNLMVQTEVSHLNVGKLAKAMGVSENHLSVVIKKETNITVKKWIERKTEALMRILLIDERNYTLEEIANIVGYSSPPQVVRFFKRRTGMTPFEFRKAKLAEKALRS